MLPNRRNDIWRLTNLFGIIAGYQSTSVHSGMKTKNHKNSVFGKDKALPLLLLFLCRNLSAKVACTSSQRRVYSSGCSFWWVLLLLYCRLLKVFKIKLLWKVCSCVFMMKISNHS